MRGGGELLAEIVSARTLLGVKMEGAEGGGKPEEGLRHGPFEDLWCGWVEVDQRVVEGPAHPTSFVPADLLEGSIARGKYCRDFRVC